MGDAAVLISTDRLQLNCFDYFPTELLDVPAHDLWRHLQGPSLFQLGGRHDQPLFVSVLLHGNEVTGWQAIQVVLRRFHGNGLPRSLLVFVGNIEAAKANVRTLPQQTDYNRVWPGTVYEATAEARLMREVVEIVRKHRPFASIDIHNNTGNNPHYGCVNRLEESFLHLARLFSRTVVYFTQPIGVQSAVFSEFCPSVTVECGRPVGMAGVEHAAEFISSALAISHFPDHPLPQGDLDLMQTFAIVKVPAGATMSSNGADADFCFRADLDRLNFSEVEAGVAWGTLGASAMHRLEVLPGSEEGVGDPYFAYRDKEILLSRPAIPAMISLDLEAVRLDCLCYLMHRIGRDGQRIVT